MFKKLLLSLLLLTAVLSATAPTQESVTKLYVATFDRAPDASGLAYWLNDSGLSLEQIAMSFFDQKETQEKYPASTTTSAFVEAVYDHLFKREPDDAGWKYWIEGLDSGDTPRSVFILTVINGALGDDAVILDNKTEVGLYFAEKGLEDAELARAVMAIVTADPQSVVDAKAMIDSYDLGTMVEAELQDNVILVVDNIQNDILTRDTQNEKDYLTVSSDFIKTVQSGSIITIPAGVDDRFPLGMSGRVESIEAAQNGNSNLKLSEVNLVDIVKKYNQPLSSFPLNHDNFVGTITPNQLATSPTTLRSSKGSISKRGTSYLNGAVTFLHSATSTKGSTQAEEGMFQLNLAVDMLKKDFDPKNTQPYGNGKYEMKAVISGALSSLVRQKLDMDLIAWSPYLDLDIGVEGDLSADLKIIGGASASFGYFNQAWKEVNDEKFKVWGIKGKITGLSDDDKIGKYPVLGLVFVSPAPIKMKTQTALRTAKAGGVIVWVYLVAKGELSIDGELGIATNSHFDIGLEHPKGGEFKGVHSLTGIADKRLLKVPYVNGKVAFGASLGVSVEIDAFIGGIRIGNSSVNILGKYEKKFTSNAEASYGIDSLGSPWSWKGAPICIEGSGGAGAIINFGGSIGGAVGSKSAAFNYKKQLPKEDDINDKDSGWVNSLWYVFGNTEKCWNQVQSTVKKTGQTKSYNQDGDEITDGSVKDDGHYQKGVTPSYTRDDTNQTVTDHITGLIWQDDEEAKTVKKQWLTDDNYNDCKDNDNNCENTSGDTASTYCSNLDLGGYDDWRLPTSKELEGIVDYSRYSPSISSIFENINTNYYWSSTTDRYYSNDAWIVHFYGGYMINHPMSNPDRYKNNNYYIRCARGGE